MPCHDITESMELVLDEKNRIDSYRLSKKTCGGKIGAESLIIDSIHGEEVESFIQQKFKTDYLPNNCENEIESFLRSKHLYAIECTIRVYLGEISGGVNQVCTIAGIEYDGLKTIIKADIKSNLAVDRIESCDHCGPT